MWIAVGAAAGQQLAAIPLYLRLGSAETLRELVERFIFEGMGAVGGGLVLGGLVGWALWARAIARWRLSAAAAEDDPVPP